MPRHPDYESIYQNMIQQYGKKKGEQVYYSWLNRHKYDDTKSFPNKNKGDMMEPEEFRIFSGIEKVDEEKRMVYGYATTEAIDAQGEVVLLDATRKALGDYSQWRNVREMHQPKAVGTAPVLDLTEKGLYVGAKIVDDSAWIKVKEGVLKGFSIGGKCRLREIEVREGKDVPVIKDYTLTEISLVDRPANPEAVFSLVKIDTGEDIEKARVTAMEEKRTALKMSPAEFYAAPRDPPSESALPIFDEAHVRNALARFNQTDLSPEEKDKAKRKILAAAKKFGIDVGSEDNAKKGDLNEERKKEMLNKGDIKMADEEKKPEPVALAPVEPVEPAKEETVAKKEYDALKAKVDEIQKSLESKDAEIKKLVDFGNDLVKRLEGLEPVKKVASEPVIAAEDVKKMEFKDLAAKVIFE